MRKPKFQIGDLVFFISFFNEVECGFVYKVYEDTCFFYKYKIKWISNNSSSEYFTSEKYLKGINDISPHFKLNEKFPCEIKK